MLLAIIEFQILDGYAYNEDATTGGEPLDHPVRDWHGRELNPCYLANFSRQLPRCGYATKSTRS